MLLLSTHVVLWSLSAALPFASNEHMVKTKFYAYESSVRFKLPHGQLCRKVFGFFLRCKKRCNMI